ncbi:MAG: hypothetical protein IJS67_02185 [Clostridia bacterium]|nr:hypothetical protein [Clostridia bacterium]
MKVKYKFSTVIYLLFAAFYLVAAISLVWNAVRLVQSLTGEISLTVFNYISTGLGVILPLLFGALMTAALLRSQYEVTENKLVLRFGFLKDEYSLSDISSIVKNLRYMRLTLFFADGSSVRIIIDEKHFDEFSSSILKSDKNIVYGETDEEDAKKD